MTCNVEDCIKEIVSIVLVCLPARLAIGFDVLSRAGSGSVRGTRFDTVTLIIVSSRRCLGRLAVNSEI